MNAPARWSDPDSRTTQEMPVFSVSGVEFKWLPPMGHPFHRMSPAEQDAYLAHLDAQLAGRNPTADPKDLDPTGR